ncbi:MAG: sce7726 family protein [Pseudomonadota bacterium]
MRDRDVRESVWSWLEKVHGEDENTLMLDELGILNGSTRIDIAVVNGEMTGFELKSEKDTLERLPAQRDLYNLVLDRVSLVVAETHQKEAIKIIPDWWGVWIAHPSKCGGVEVSQEREALANQMLDAETICSFLWRNEALEILERYGAARGVKSKSRDIIYRRLSEELTLDTVRREVRTALKSRQGWRADRRSQQCGG